MRAYETVFIVDPDIPDEDVDQITERFARIVDDFSGKVAKVEKWGRRKLAYRVKKRTKGNYILLVFLGDHKLTTELERILKLDDRILKYLTVRVDKHAEIDLVKEKEAEEQTEEEELNGCQEES